MSRTSRVGIHPAVTERAVCALDGTSVGPAEFACELLSLHDAGAECT